MWTIGSDLQPFGDVMGALSAGVRSALVDERDRDRLAHAPGVDGVPTLFVGTSRPPGLRNRFRTRREPQRHMVVPLAFEPTVVDRDPDALRPIGANVGEAPAEVRDLVLDGAGPDQLDTLWMAMPPGIHRLDLRTLAISFGGDLVHPGQDGRSITGADDVHSLLVLDDALLVGSAWAFGWLTADVKPPMAREQAPSRRVGGLGHRRS